MSARVPGILFLCIHNAGRSQMAAGFARAFGGDAVRVFSGGSEPASTLNPVAVEVMAEAGIDISGVLPRKFTEGDLDLVDVVVTMGCGDTCPVIPGKRYLDWRLEDPAGQPAERVRAIRNDIAVRVRCLVDELNAIAQA